MKHLLLLLLLIPLSIKTEAQSGQVTCTAYKQIFWIDGEWGDWPNHWTTYSSERRSNPILRITKIDNGVNFRIQMYIDDIVEADFYVQYDSDKTDQVRDDWDEPDVSCYYDSSGDYIYTENCYLSELAENPNIWSSREDSKIYLWIFSEDFAIVVK